MASEKSFGSFPNDLADKKLTSFALGQTKKSRFQRDREEKERKRKQDEEEAAKVFESFVESFQGEDERRGTNNSTNSLKSFVRSGASDETYRLGRDRSNSEAMQVKQSNCSNKKKEMDLFMEESETTEEMKKPLHSTSKRRQMDELFDEIKTKHETQNFKSQVGPLSRGPVEEKGSFDNGDPTTTNLFVGNLNPLTTEEHLSEVFGRYGEIISVKIMWPRTNDERARGRNTGFVSFSKRRDAERVLVELKESVLDGHIIQVGWSKAVKSNSSVPHPAIQAGPSVTKLANESTPVSLPSVSSVSKGYHTSSTESNFQPSYPAVSVTAPVIQIHVPKDGRRRSIIDLLASFVAADGEAFEMAIKQRELHNPEFSFLYEQPPHYSSDALYYRWCVLACVNGDAYTKGSNNNGFQFTYWQEDRRYQPVIGGCVFQAPALPPNTIKPLDYKMQETLPSNISGKKRSHGNDNDGMEDDEEFLKRSRYEDDNVDENDEKLGSFDEEKKQRKDKHDKFASMTGAQIQRYKEAHKQRKRLRLTEEEYSDFKTLLASLCLSRESIAECMTFAFDHVECSEDVLWTISRKLLPDIVMTGETEQGKEVEDVWFVTQLPLLMASIQQASQETDEETANVQPSQSKVLRQEVYNRNAHHPAVFVATLFLLSDILHNSASPLRHASHYKQHIENHLPQIFQNLGWMLREGNLGRMTFTQMKDRVLQVLMTWAEWSVFPPLFLEGLRTFFLLSHTSSTSNVDDMTGLMQDTIAQYHVLNEKRQTLETGDKCVWLQNEAETLRKQAKFHGVYFDFRAHVFETESLTSLSKEKERQLLLHLAGVSAKIALVSRKYESLAAKLEPERETADVEDVKTEAVMRCEEEDIDGVPLRMDDVDGAPLDGETDNIDGVPLEEDIDGVPMQCEEEDIDGVPMEDIDGVPLDG